MFTAYELMRRRFGERIRKLTASIFLVTRALAEGVRVFAISLVISIVLGTGEIASIVADRRADAVLHLRRRHDGGDLDRRGADEPVRGSARSLSFFVILGKIPGGWAHVAAVAGAGSQVRDLRFPLRAHHGILRAHLHVSGPAWRAAAS